MGCAADISPMQGSRRMELSSLLLLYAFCLLLSRVFLIIFAFSYRIIFLMAYFPISRSKLLLFTYISIFSALFPLHFRSFQYVLSIFFDFHLLFSLRSPAYLLSFFCPVCYTLYNGNIAGSHIPFSIYKIRE